MLRTRTGISSSPLAPSVDPLAAEVVDVDDESLAFYGLALARGCPATAGAYLKRAVALSLDPGEQAPGRGRADLIGRLGHDREPGPHDRRPVQVVEAQHRAVLGKPEP